MTLSVRLWNETANFYYLRMIPWCSCGRCKLSHFQLSYAAFRQDFKAYPIVAEEDAKENTSAKKEARRLRVRERHLNLRTQCLGGVWSNGCILMFAVLHGGQLELQIKFPSHMIEWIHIRENLIFWEYGWTLTDINWIGTRDLHNFQIQSQPGVRARSISASKAGCFVTRRVCVWQHFGKNAPGPSRRLRGWEMHLEPPVFTLW